MGCIKRLSGEVIAKTKAGQVVSDQADVIKELIENSLDAGATEIKVTIADNGLKEICVIDNGHGMDASDLKLCSESYTTSKIFSLEDLAGVRSLGFRGEALAIINSVADLSIVSENNTANCGTQVWVKNLFASVPARKKFLKSPQTQYRAILKTIIDLALSHPEVGFSFVSDKKVILDLVKSQALIERAADIFGHHFVSNLFEFEHAEPHFKLHGYLSKPQISTTFRNNQFIYVNNRFVKNDLISSAVKEAYGTLLEARSHPPFVIRLELAPEFVDVNVDPKKHEVRFINEDFIYTFVKSGVVAALKHADLSFKDVDYLNTDVHGNLITREDRKMLGHMGSLLKNVLKVWSPRQLSETQVLQVNNLYLVYETAEGITLIDQHAAHERILFEQFLEVFTSGAATKNVYVLKKPLILEFSMTQADIVKQYYTELLNLGFALETFGERHYRLMQLPDVLKNADAQVLIIEILETLSHDHALEGLHDAEEKVLLKLANKKIIQTLNFLACRSAIKAGDVLNDQERKNLIEKLDASKGLYTCPHGRPVRVVISWRELGRMFKRV